MIKAKYTVDTGTAVAGGVAMASALAGIDSYRMGLDLQLIASGELARASFPSQATAKGPRRVIALRRGKNNKARGRLRPPFTFWH